MDVTSYMLGKKAGGGGGSEYTAGTNIEITEDNVINNSISYVEEKGNNNIYIGQNITKASSQYNMLVVGNHASANVVSLRGGVALGAYALVKEPFAIAIGYGAEATEMNQCKIGGTLAPINKITLRTSEGNKDVAMVDDIKTTQYSAMPTASADNLGEIVQYIGATDENYTNGYFYQVVSDEQETPTYSWAQVNVQDGASYTAGNNIEITDEGVINNTIEYTRVGTGSSSSFLLGIPSYENFPSNNIVIGSAYRPSGNSATGNVIIGNLAGTANAYRRDTVNIGNGAQANFSESIAIGKNAKAVKVNQAMFGSSSANINEMAIYTSEGAKVMATEDYVDDLVGNINTVLATLTTVEEGE